MLLFGLFVCFFKLTRVAICALILLHKQNIYVSLLKIRTFAGNDEKASDCLTFWLNSLQKKTVGQKLEACIYLEHFQTKDI